MSAPTVTIGLLWHSMNSDNLGVGALTLGNMAIAEDAARNAGLEPYFKVLGWADPKPPYYSRSNIDVIGLRAKDLNPLGGKLASEVKQCDVVLDIGAGDSFADIYGPGRIAKMLLASNIILNAGVPLILSPQTIGPFKNAAIKRAALNIMRRAQFVASRDQLSTEFARKMGFDGRLIEASDVALRLPYMTANEDVDQPFQVGINVSGLLFNGGYNGANMFGLMVDYAKVIRRIVDHFSKIENCEVHLVSHVQSKLQEVEDDRRAALRLAKDFPDVIAAPEFNSPSEAKSYIAGMDYFVGARMHSCIAAFSSGVPVTPMAYSRKFEGFFGALGYNIVADCKSETEDEIFTKIVSGFENRAELSRKLVTARDKGLEKLKPYESALQDILDAAVRKAA